MFPCRRALLLSAALVAACCAVGASPLAMAQDRPGRASKPRQIREQPRPTRRLNAVQAKALALKVHAEAAAMDRLPRFSYRVKSGNGVVDTMRDREECSIDGLKEALDGDIADADWWQQGRTLSWTENHVLWSRGVIERRQFDERGAKGDYGRVWTQGLAFERGAADGEPARFVYTASDVLWGGCLNELAYFRVTPHRFWWATSDDHNDTISPVPPEEADYRFITREPFDHEICDVVESPSRAERLWIGRESGRLRGVLVLRYNGDGSEDPFYQHSRVQKIAGRPFATQQEYVDWVRGKAISTRQRAEITRAWCELHFDVFGPNELIRFRDYREVAPGVWIPFREDRAFTHRAEGNRSRHKYIRLWVAVEEARTGVDLTDRVESLRPKEGEQIQDQRFGVVINYEHKRDRTPDDVLELVEAERQKRTERDAARLAAKNLVGSPAPELSGEVWLNADEPPTWKSLRGKPVLLVLFDLKQASFLPLVPPLLAFQEMYDKQGLAVVGVHAKGPSDEVEKRLAEECIKFPVLIDDGKTAERYGTGFSVSVLIDREGKVVSVYKDSLAPPAEIEKLLEEMVDDRRRQEREGSDGANVYD